MPLSLPSLLLAALFATLLTAAHSQPPTTAYPHCNRTFSCGNITNVIYPFTGGARPSHCGPPEFALACRNNTVTELTHDQLTYRVLQLHQTQRTLVLSRSDLYTNTCTSEFYNTTLNNTLFSSDGPQNENLTLFYGCDSAMKTRPLSHFSCYSEHFNYSDAYYMVGAVPMDPFFWESTNCSITINVPVPRAVGNQLMDLQLNLEEGLRQGFTVNYSVPGEGLCLNCSKLGGQCGFDSDSDQPVCVCGDRPCPFALALPTEEESKKRSSDLKMSVMKRVSFGLSFLLLSFLIIFYVTRKYRLHEQDIEINQNIEKFLLNHGSLTPNRYKYKDIKKITKSFTDKLGQGAYGIVYKGKLSDGQLIAVKVLTDTDDIAEDFVNEVASISRTSHVNIVNLLGFCYERKKRALIYEYMPNKSLDKFISKNRSLEWEKLYEIAVGVARGLEYLHRGCNTRIVHFDIKPQNILLDEDFRPKISDFGLAKLFKKKQSVMSTLGTRGTIGYIAPEVFSRNFGAASHKSDVYSYGMMLLEMAGAKRNVEIDSSENDFSDKIYERVILVENEILDDVMTDENEETGRKMLLIGVWCIQIAPSDRPSMSKVVEMLEGSLQSIQIPPKPFISSPVLSETQFSSSFSTKFDD